MNWFKKLLYRFFGVEATIDSAVKTKREEFLSAAEMLIPNFPQIRDEQAKIGVVEFKDGRDMVRTGTRKMNDGSEKVELSQILGSRVKLPK